MLKKVSLAHLECAMHRVQTKHSAHYTMHRVHNVPSSAIYQVWWPLAVVGGWRRSLVGHWWLVAVGKDWRPAVGRRCRLARVGGGWWRLVVGGLWTLGAVLKGGP